MKQSKRVKIKYNTSSAESLKRYMSFTITLWIGVVISIIAFVSVLSSNMESLKEKFIYESNFKIENLRNELNGHQRGAQLVQKFFESSNEVTKEEFYNFTLPLYENNYFSHLLWLDVNQTKNTSYTVTLSTTKEGYTDFSEINPTMDLSPYPEIVEAVEQTLKTGQPTLSRNMTFPAESPHYIAMIYPAFKANKIIGVAVAVLDLETLFDKRLLISASEQYQHIHIYNKNSVLFIADSEELRFYLASNVKEDASELIKTATFHYKSELSILSDEWSIIFTPTNRYIALATNWYPWLILCLGIAITAILGVLQFSLIGRNIRIENAIKSATKELENTKLHNEIILKTVMEGIITINTSGVIQTFNPAAERIFGYQSKEVIGKNVKILMSDDNKKNHDQYIHNYLDTGEAKIIGVGREVEALKKDGSRFPMGLGITETTLDGEKIFVGLVRDISADKIAQRKMREYNKKLEDAWANASKANQSKSEFLATMSHEIRTPMNGIIGMAELMSYSELTPQQDKYIQTIQSSGNLLLSLINDILDFSKIEARELKLENIPTVLNAILSEATQLLSTRASDNQVELAVHIADDVPMSILGDPVRLRQIIINLMGNAIKFSKGGYVLIDVKKVNHEKDAVTLRFEVRDTGIGIPKDKVKAVFEQFSQVDSSTTREFGGTGLGLTICKRLVELMGGKIGLESVEGEGSIFWFEVAAKATMEDAQHKLDEKKLKQLQKAKILVVDNYQVNLDVISEYLGRKHIHCDVTDSQEQAFIMLSEKKKAGKPYDIVLVDRNMNCVEVGKNISSNPKEYGAPKLVLVTSFDKLPYADFLQDAGYTTKLLKPIYAHRLIDTLLHTYCADSQLSTQKLDNLEDKPNGLKQYNAKVLVVEDFSPNRDVAESIMLKLGCEVELAVDGEAAIEMLNKDHHYDVVFMDCQMPNMDGFDTTKEIRKTKWGSELVIVALTANALHDDKEKCLNAGMNDYISKPIKISEVTDVMDIFVKKDKKSA